MENIIPPILRIFINNPSNISELTERLITHWFDKIRFGRLTIQFPSGRSYDFLGRNPGPEAYFQIRTAGLARRIILNGDLGFAESYIAGEWETPDLPSLLLLGVMNEKELSSVFSSSKFYLYLNRLRHFLRSNTKQGSRRNIASHYDLGNDFYKHWLDEGLSYLSGIFENLHETHELAQRRKYLRLAELLHLSAGDRLLEIGCGWGHFAEIASKQFGCHVVGLTLSREQAVFARQRIKRAGGENNVVIRLQDYREVAGRFDKIVSIEMFEAVGEANWLTYFRTIERLLVPGGRAAIQSIVIDEKYFNEYRRTPDFIQRYIFPGGMLPSAQSLKAAAEISGMQITDEFYFRKSYAETLRRWRTAFIKAWTEISKLGFDNRFKKIWNYYLSYCEAGFEVGKINVGQFLIEKKGNN